MWFLALLALTPADRALVAQFECHRCHDGLPLKPLPMERHCVRCHRAILDGALDVASEIKATWQQNLHSLPAAPQLTGTGRFQRSWLERFLLSPDDLRPGLDAMMPRLALSEDQARRLAAALAPIDEPPVATDLELVSQGARLFAAKSCGACHAYSGVTAAPARPDPRQASAIPILLAPDLRHARARLRPSLVAAFIRNPESVAPGARMPNLNISKIEAEALAAFVLHAPLAILPEPPPEPRLPVLERSVRWAEVEAKVFRKVCWHCHSDPDLAHNDGGPGNTGGFGFRGAGLDLSSYRGIVAGSTRLGRKVLRASPGELAPIVAVLLARQKEVRGEVSTMRGMPLGLPPLTPQEIQLVESWVAQGRPE